ncbi:MAG: ATP-binding protein [Thermodesulfobacteriota bacterium]
MNLFRVLREIMHNIIKHAQASTVDVSIKRVNDRVQISVTDDGVGFEEWAPWSKMERAGGIGLFSIRERLDYLGGSIRIKSKPGTGTTITLTAPLKSDA